MARRRAGAAPVERERRRVVELEVVQRRAVDARQHARTGGGACRGGSRAGPGPERRARPVQHDVLVGAGDEAVNGLRQRPTAAPA